MGSRCFWLTLSVIAVICRVLVDHQHYCWSCCYYLLCCNGPHCCCLLEGSLPPCHCWLEWVQGLGLCMLAVYVSCVVTCGKWNSDLLVCGMLSVSLLNLLQCHDGYDLVDHSQSFHLLSLHRSKKLKALSASIMIE